MPPIIPFPSPRVVELLLNAAVGVMPTDTIYGLVCQAANPAAVQRLYSLKHRQHNPGTLIAASAEQLVGLGLKARYVKPVESYWPNPISIIIPCGAELAYLHLGAGGVACRLPADETLQALLLQTGPLLTSSANQPHETPAETVSQAQAYFANQVDFYADGGKIAAGKPSTIIRVVDDAVEVLRQGSIEIDDKGVIIKT